MSICKIGVYGLGVMGRSLAVNIARHGYQTAVYNMDSKVTEEVMRQYPKLSFHGAETLSGFLNSLEKPRCILLMITAGKAVDEVLQTLVPLLDEEDMIIDGGNSFYKDTMRRAASCRKAGVHFLGMGVSGGEHGAMFGPCLMPSGDEGAYRCVEEILLAICAKADHMPCCTYIGPSGSGHFVKMVHNGIEYADIQLIGDAYWLMKHAADMSDEAIGQVFEKWNTGKLRSYLIEITAKIMKQRDDRSDDYLLNQILDRAGQKGTGKWTSMESLDMGVAAPSIAEAVYARAISAMKTKRVNAASHYPKEKAAPVDADELISRLEAALYAARVCVYAQGFDLIMEASRHYGWSLDCRDIARIWRNGCIIRADFLEDIGEALSETNGELMVSDFAFEVLPKGMEALREAVLAGVRRGCYIPAFTSTLSYYDGYRSADCSANLIQAQRDFFGAHTYQRRDFPESMSFHTKWEETK